MLTQFNILKDRLGNPEYLYLVLEPLALYGLFFGLLFLGASLMLKQDKARMIALFFIALSSVSVVPYLHQREIAQRRLMVVRDAGYTRLMEKHTRLRNDTKWVNYSLAGLALLAMIGKGKIASIAHAALFIGGLLALGFFLWLHLKESEIYHPNLRKAMAAVSTVRQ